MHIMAWESCFKDCYLCFGGLYVGEPNSICSVPPSINDPLVLLVVIIRSQYKTTNHNHVMIVTTRYNILPSPAPAFTL